MCMGVPATTDWTTGPAKWFAVGVLGAAALGGIAWSVFWREPRPIHPLVSTDRVQPPATVDGPATPAGAPIQRPPPDPEPPPASQPRESKPPVHAPEQVPAPAPEATPPVARLININTATAAELELLPGIGPALAGRIVEYRAKHGPFKSVDELDHVSGIGPRTLAKIRPVAKVE
jgi:competence protein ComEA